MNEISIYTERIEDELYHYMLIHPLDKYEEMPRKFKERLDKIFLSSNKHLMQNIVESVREEMELDESLPSPEPSDNAIEKALDDKQRWKDLQ